MATKSVEIINVGAHYPDWRPLSYHKKKGWSFTHPAFRLNLNEYKGNHFILRDKIFVLPDLWYITFDDTVFHLTTRSGPIAGCLEIQGKDRTNAFKEIEKYLEDNMIHRGDRIEVKPIYIGINGDYMNFFPSSDIRDFLPEEIFADLERVKRSMEKFLNINICQPVYTEED